MDIVTEANFDDFIDNDLSLVFFWEAWCGLAYDPSCINQLDEFEKETNVKSGKMNLSENPEISIKYHIRMLPTYMFFKQGMPVKTLFGVQTRIELQDAIKDLTR